MKELSILSWKRFLGIGIKSWPSPPPLEITVSAQRRDKQILFLKFILALVISNFFIYQFQQVFQSPPNIEVTSTPPYNSDEFELISIPVETIMAFDQNQEWTEVTLYSTSRSLFIHPSYIHNLTPSIRAGSWEVNSEFLPQKQQDQTVYQVAIPKKDLATFIHARHQSWEAIPSMEPEQIKNLLKNKSLSNPTQRTVYELLY